MLRLLVVGHVPEYVTTELSIIRRTYLEYNVPGVEHFTKIFVVYCTQSGEFYVEDIWSIIMYIDLSILR